MGRIVVVALSLAVLLAGHRALHGPGPPASERALSRPEALVRLAPVPGAGRFAFVRIDRKEAKLVTRREWERRQSGGGRGPLAPDAPVWVVMAEGAMGGAPVDTPAGPQPLTVGGLVIDARTGETLEGFASTGPWPDYWDWMADRARGG
jgi:hypothetical protein